MDSVIRNLSRMVDAIGRELQRFDETTWCVLAVGTVVFGYFLLRGNPNH